MPARIGIELSPTACRIVEVTGSRGGDDADTTVRTFARTPTADEATLAPYRRQGVAVVVWGLHGEHRQAVVTVGSYQRMRREAVNATREAGVDTRQMVADIAPATSGKEGGRRRPVVIALARTSDVAAALRPLTSAGLKVRSIVTPALALMSLARMRRRITAPGMAEAYVALEETGTAIALVRDGALVAARELDWGFLNEERARSRDEVASRLGAAIEEFFGDYGVRPSAVAQVCVCGGLPELRSMTLALTQQLDVEVEPLDSLFGIDADHLPEPGDDFRERAVDLRLAWAVAADWNAPLNFLRERRRRLAKTVLTRAAVVAGVATGVAVAWRIQRSDWLEPAKPVVSAPAPRPVAARPSTPAPTPAPVPTPQPPPVAARPPAITQPAVAPVTQPQPPAAAIAKPAPAPITKPAVVIPQPAIAAITKPIAPTVQPSPAPASTPPPRATPPAALVLTPVPAAVVPPPRKAEPVAQPPVRLTPVPVPVPTPPVRVAVAPTVTAAPSTAPARATPTRDPQLPPAPPQAAVSAPVRRPPPEEVPLPFDAVLGTILYGPDRKLAIVDGHIVQVGADVRGARVVDITPNAVFLRDRQGRLRRLTVEDSGR